MCQNRVGFILDSLYLIVILRRDRGYVESTTSCIIEKVAAFTIFIARQHDFLLIYTESMEAEGNGKESQVVEENGVTVALYHNHDKPGKCKTFYNPKMKTCRYATLTHSHGCTDLPREDILTVTVTFIHTIRHCQ